MRAIRRVVLGAALALWAGCGFAADAYSAGILSLTTAASATDIFTITGSATKTVRITELTSQCTETTAGVVAVQLLKRSAANTGGTSTTPTVVPHDSTSPAGTATVRAYTANPSGLGALVGLVRATRETWLAPASVASASRNPFTFYNGLSVVLRGTSEVLAVNLNGVTVTGGTCALWATWTEE